MGEGIVTNEEKSWLFIPRLDALREGLQEEEGVIRRGGPNILSY